MKEHKSIEGDYWKCRKCGLHNKPTNKFCSECGTNLKNLGLKVSILTNIMFLFISLMIIFFDVGISAYISSPFYNFSIKPIDVKIFFGSMFILISLVPYLIFEFISRRKVKENAPNDLSKQEIRKLGWDFMKQNIFLLIVDALTVFATVFLILNPLIESF